ncbi:MAG: hypothetical protein L0H63_03545, partial [Nitrococcus sp.]|nr:hypothetical protein [Nitrococcus sp.]
MVDNLAAENTKVAIYDWPGSFSDRWIEVCSQREIPYITVDLFDNELFMRLRHANVTAFLCHPVMREKQRLSVAQAIIQALALTQLRVFPKPEDYWHFEDKIAQKYLFDGSDIPTPATHIFFNPRDALKWARSAEFPCVAKVNARTGALGVSLMHDCKEVKAWSNEMFGRGKGALNSWLIFIARKIRSFRVGRASLGIAMRSPRTMWSSWREYSDIPRERGYVYLQEFLGSSYRTQVIVIGNRAFAHRTTVRPGDFRTFKSGAEDDHYDDYDPAVVDIA